MKGQTDEDASEQEEGKGEEDTNREISLKAHSSYRELQHGLTKEEPYTEWMEWMSHWNGKKLSSSKAQLDQATYLAVV